MAAMIHKMYQLAILQLLSHEKRNFYTSHSNKYISSTFIYKMIRGQTRDTVPLRVYQTSSSG